MMLIQYVIVTALYFIVIMIPFGLVAKVFLIMPDLGGLKVVIGVLLLIAFFYLSFLARMASKIFVFEHKGFIASLSDANRRNLSTITIWLCFVPVLGPIIQKSLQLDEEGIRQKENRKKIMGDR